MKIVIILLFILSLSFTKTYTIGFSNRQDKNIKHQNEIYFDFQSQPIDNHYEIQIFYQIPNHFLKFLQKDQQYINEHEITIYIFKNDTLYREIYRNRTINEKRYAKTVTHDYFYIKTDTFYLNPGKYKIQATIKDKNSENKYQTSDQLNLKQIEKNSLVSSSLLFYYSTFDQGGTTCFIPNVSAIYQEYHDLLYFRYQISSGYQKPLSLSIRYQLIDRSEKKVIQELQKKIDIGNNNQIPISDSIEIDDLKNGLYTIKMDIISNNNDSLKQQKVFMKKKSYTTLDLDYEEHIDLLSLIASAKELDSLMASKGNKQKEKEALDSFWERREQKGNNQRFTKQEFYRRAQIVMKEFSLGEFRKAWRTDMGRIFILYGEPDHIDRYDYSSTNNPYQIWYYYSTGKKFIFVDRNGFGEYELISNQNGYY